MLFRSSASVAPMLAMKAGGRGGTEGPSHLRLGNALVAMQIALSFVLLAGAGLLIGSFRHLATLDPGFHSEGVMLMNMEFPIARYSRAQSAAASREILERLRLAPGVRSAGASYRTPVEGGSWTQDLIILRSHQLGSKQDDREVNAHYNRVSDGFFETLGTPVLKGRDFNLHDTARSPLVAIINEAMAEKFFSDVHPLEDLLGQRIRLRAGNNVGAVTEIVGIVKDVRHVHLRDAAPPTLYMPLSQDAEAHSSITFAIRSAGPPAAVIAAAKSVIDRKSAV